MTPMTSTPELISALADGQLHGDEWDRLWNTLDQNEDAVAHWRDYHLIGDALRAVDVSFGDASHARSASFVDRLNAILASEPRHSAATGAEPVQASPSLVQGTAMPADPSLPRGEAVNDGVFRWKLVAGFASLAAVGVMAWTAVGTVSPAASSPQLAQGPETTQVLVPSPQGVMVRDARLNELLAAHKQLGATSALQAPSGFLQSAAFDVSPSTGR